jgi:hypothetical protein
MKCKLNKSKRPEITFTFIGKIGLLYRILEFLTQKIFKNCYSLTNLKYLIIIKKIHQHTLFYNFWIFLT